MAATAPSLPANRIGDYEILEQLGAGGMGVVYKAFDRKLERTVALKFLNAARPIDRKRLLHEARAASTLDHPNIAAVHAVEDDSEGRLFLVMAYYEGQSLADRLSQGPLAPAEAVDIARQIAAGLEHAHRHGIIHRDIKPSNVVLTAEGALKIVDFGLAHHLAPTDTTQSMNVSGTLPYMSPEQLRGTAVDFRTDIWSLGVVLYEMLTGRLPFQGDSPAAAVMQILSSAPAASPELPDPLRQVIERALAKDPTQRYATCAEVSEELARFSGVSLFRATGSTNSRQSTLSIALSNSGAIGKLRVRAALAVVCLGILAAGYAVYLRTGARPQPKQWHIAVLPAVTNPDAVVTQSLADGLMENIGGRLSALDSSRKSLWVVPSSELRRRNINDPSAAQREFEANVVLRPAMDQNGDQLRLRLELIETRTSRLLGSAVVEGKVKDLPSMEATAVSRASMLMNLGAQPWTAASEMVPAAYESYLKGRGYLQRYDKAGNIDAAIAQFQSAIDVDPSFALAFAALGEAYWYKYRLDRNPSWLEQADLYCRRAVRANDQLPAVYVMLGRIHSDAQKELALSEFQHALKLEPRNADAMVGLAGVYETMGRIGDAEGLFQQAAALRPDYWGGYQDLAHFYFRNRQYDKAIEEFRRVVSLTPDNAQAHSSLGIALVQTSALEEAEKELKKSISLQPTYYALSNLGVLYYQQKRWTEAGAALESALRMNQNDFRVWANLGMVYEWLDKRKEAENVYREELHRLEPAVKLRPDDPDLRCELGLLYSRQGARAKALALVQSAVTGAPANPDVLACAAEAYESAGDRTRALPYVKKALAYGITLDDLQHCHGLQKLLLDPRFQAAVLAESMALKSGANSNPNPHP